MVLGKDWDDAVTAIKERSEEALSSGNQSTDDVGSSSPHSQVSEELPSSESEGFVLVLPDSPASNSSGSLRNSFERHVLVVTEELARGGVRMTARRTFMEAVAIGTPALRRSRSDSDLVLAGKLGTQDASRAAGSEDQLLEGEGAANDAASKLAAHKRGACVPCNWQRRFKGCKYGDACGYCHLKHWGRSRRRGRNYQRNFLPAEEDGQGDRIGSRCSPGCSIGMDCTRCRPTGGADEVP